ncbi:heterokaryon incompatibility protein-domain-containing protein [Xylariaceae sp. FL0016]|nr:heterokaryon incompatibility protein-domain-containing protein [Xylariaceae sp. FL0016]
MRLLNTVTLALEHFIGDQTPEYAILSHVWQPNEVVFEDWPSGAASKQESYNKVVLTCRQARADGHEYVWIDTICIDKSSSSELTEAINSMFEWYASSEICYAYLADVDTFDPLTYASDIRRSRWFTRGWTLQELLAPRSVRFFAADWSELGTRTSLARHIRAATGIGLQHLHWKDRGVHVGQARDIWEDRHSVVLQNASVAERMSWLARRNTTRIEDMAYCMLGIFGINMSLVYGEGPRAFIRLQEEIIRTTDDHSLFCWSWATSMWQESLIAPRPQAFLMASQFVPLRRDSRPRPTVLANGGLTVSLSLIDCWGWSSFIGVMNVKSSEKAQRFGIMLRGDLNTGRFQRCQYPDVPIPICNEAPERWNSIEIWVPSRNEKLLQSSKKSGVYSRLGLLLSFGDPDDFISVETWPPGRFNSGESIVETCPSTVQQSDSSRWSADIISEDGALLTGATLVEFTLGNRRKEVVLFVATPVRDGDKLRPPNAEDHEKEAIVETGYSEDEARRLIKLAVTDPSQAEDIGIPTSESESEVRKFSVNMANAPFLTTASSILQHAHISLTIKNATPPVG